MSTSAIANNLTTTSSGYVLDARQGKELNKGTPILSYTDFRNCVINNYNPLNTHILAEYFICKMADSMIINKKLASATHTSIDGVLPLLSNQNYAFLKISDCNLYQTNTQNNLSTTTWKDYFNDIIGFSIRYRLGNNGGGIPETLGSITFYGSLIYKYRTSSSTTYGKDCDDDIKIEGYLRFCSAPSGAPETKVTAICPLAISIYKSSGNDTSWQAYVLLEYGSKMYYF